MNIAYIISMKKGIAPFIYSELEELENQGIGVTIFPTKLNKGMTDPKDSWTLYKFNPLFTVVKQPWYFLKNPFMYTKLLFESLTSGSLKNFLISTELKEQMNNMDRIHCHFGDDKFFIGYYCKKWTNLPLSVTIHAHELFRNNMKMFRKSLDLCDTIVSISELNKKILMKDFNVPKEKILVNKMFVDTDHFKYKEKVKVLIAAFFHEKKGHEYLLRACKEANNKDIELWVVGDRTSGYADVDVQTIAKELGIEDQVCFFGLQTGTALKALYNECDIFCLPSVTLESGESEGIPVSLMEAMSYSKPVISTKHAGIPELVKDILVEERDVKNLAKALNTLAKNAQLRKKQGTMNRKIILDKHSKHNTKNLIRLFTDGNLNNH